MTKRNRTLDVLRAVAIILVINSHATTGYLTQNPDVVATPVMRAMGLGGHGVDLFFVLSGWLLGSILCREFVQSGTIDVRRFWMRRWLRTLPAYYAVLLLTFAQAYLNGRPIAWSYLVFLQNYVSDLPYFSISWSLCVEEHFYLLIGPLLLLILPDRRRSLVGFLALLAIPSFCRLMGWYDHLENTHARFDQCAAGVCLAYIATFRPALWKQLQQALPALLLIGAAAAIWMVRNRVVGSNDLPLDLYTFVFGGWILLSQSNEFWSARLSIPGSQHIAERAYSLYLLHVEAISLMKYLPAVPWPLYLLGVWVGSLILAEVLYRSVELPGMQLRELLSSVRTRVEPASK